MSVQAQERAKPSATPPGKPSRRASILTRLGQIPGVGGWEAALAVLVVVVLILGSVTSRPFGTGENFAITATASLSLALMVIPMAWLMIAGEIDLSIASVFGLAATVFGVSIRAGLPGWLAFVLGLATGALCGLLNGLVSVNTGIPSLIVTIGTSAIYRGTSFIALQNEGISNLPPALTTFAQGSIPRTVIPYGFVLFTIIAVVAALLLHKGTIGRKVFAIGSNPQVSRFSGLRVRRIKRGLFIWAGLMAATAGMLYAGYINTVRATNGVGMELVVIGIVLIGGVDMYGGRGSFVGVLLSLLLITTLTSWMSLQFWETNVQYMVTGLIMIGAVVIPALAKKFRQR